MKKLFFGFYGASKTDSKKIHTQTTGFMTIRAESRAEALGIACEQCHIEYPLELGWRKHYQIMSEAPQHIIDEIRSDKWIEEDDGMDDTK